MSEKDKVKIISYFIFFHREIFLSEKDFYRGKLTRFLVYNLNLSNAEQGIFLEKITIKWPVY